MQYANAYQAYQHNRVSVESPAKLIEMLYEADFEILFRKPNAVLKMKTLKKRFIILIGLRIFSRNC